MHAFSQIGVYACIFADRRARRSVNVAIWDGAVSHAIVHKILLKWDFSLFCFEHCCRCCPLVYSALVAAVALFIAACAGTFSGSAADRSLASEMMRSLARSLVPPQSERSAKRSRREEICAANGYFVIVGQEVVGLLRPSHARIAVMFFDLKFLMFYIS